MRWISRLSVLALIFALTSSALAAGADEQYLDIYNEILQGDSQLASGHSEAAALRYLQAQTDLQKLQSDHPSWNPDIVKFRLDYLATQLQSLAKYIPASMAPSAPATAPAPTTPGPSTANQDATALQQQNAGYQEQIRALTSSNTELASKLKEALSVQPASANPDELAKAQARITALQKERDLLAVALEQEKAYSAGASAQAQAAAIDKAVAASRVQADADLKKSQEELALAKLAEEESEKKLAAANEELVALKAERAREADAQLAATKKNQEEMDQLKEAGVESAKIIAAATRELELLSTARPAEISAGTNAPEETDQLKQLLNEIQKDEAEISRLKQEVADAQQKLADANSQLEAARSTPAAPLNATDESKVLVAERDKLKEELAQRSKDLADAEAHHSEELLTVRNELQQAEQRRDELEKKLASNPGVANSAPDSQMLVQKVQELQAKIDILQASPVPYSVEEQALFKPSSNAPVDLAAATTPAAPATPATPATPAPPDTTTAATPGPTDTNASSAPSGHHMHSAKELPAGTTADWEQATRASMAGDFQTAEDKYNSILQIDPNNVYVLAFLANTQFAAGQLDQCETTLKRALAADPEDPGSLYLMGLLRYRQNKLDDALDALSLSAKMNPTNAATENFLGVVLADKGMRTAAETAMRKALQFDPDYADAHFNLAVVYAGNQPPSLELARWHYQRAVALGHAKSPTIEKLLESAKPGAVTPLSQ